MLFFGRDNFNPYQVYHLDFSQYFSYFISLITSYSTPPLPHICSHRTWPFSARLLLSRALGADSERPVGEQRSVYDKSFDVHIASLSCNFFLYFFHCLRPKGHVYVVSLCSTLPTENPVKYSPSKDISPNISKPFINLLLG